MKLINKLFIIFLILFFCMSFSDQITGEKKISIKNKLNKNSKSVVDFKIEGIAIYDDAINYFSKKKLLVTSHMMKVLVLKHMIF